jgi:hypothetical protein
MVNSPRLDEFETVCAAAQATVVRDGKKCNELRNLGREEFADRFEPQMNLARVKPQPRH